MDVGETAREVWQYWLEHGHEWALVAGTVWIGLKAAAVAQGQATTQAQLANLETERLRFELFGERYTLYLIVLELLRQAYSHPAEIDADALGKLSESRSKFRFLFGDSMDGYVDEVLNGVVRAQVAADEARSLWGADDDGAKQRLSSARGWVKGEIDGLSARFTPYLSFKEYRVGAQ